MAVFTIDVETAKAEAGVASLSQEVGSLSKEFDALQKSMAGSAGPNGFDWKGAQQKALGGHDQDRDAAAGLAKQQEAAAATRKEFEDLTASGDKSAETMAALREQFEGVAQAAAIGIAILTAYAVALYHLAAAAVQLTQEKDALRATFDVFTGGGGDKLLDELEDLAASLPFTADKLNVWAKSLLAAGIQGDKLKTSIQAVAAATAIMGDSGGQAALGLIKRFAMMAETGQKVKLDRRILTQMAEAGVSAKALAQALGVPAEKLGSMSLSADELGKAMQKALIQNGEKPLKLLGQTWASISAKLKEGWEDAFEDLGDLVGPFMRELENLASEFYAGGVASGTFKDAVKNALGVVFEIATRTVRAVHIAFLYLEIAFLKAKIALKPLTSALSDLGVSGGIVNVAMYAIGATALILAVVFGVLAAAVLLISAPFIIAGIAIYLVITKIRQLIAFLGEATDHMDNMKGAVSGWADSIISTISGFASRASGALTSFVMSAIAAGGNFVLGLVQALFTGQGPVADAAKQLAISAKNAVFAAMGIASPSRVMMRAGRHTAEGFALGIEAGTGDVEAAAQGTATAAIQGATAAPGKPAPAPAGGGKVEVRVEAGAIQIQGAGGNILELTEEALALLLEKVTARAGLAPVGA